MLTHLDLLPLSDVQLLGQCDVQTRRGSGPGGQKRNKTESAVRLRHVASGITASSDDTRSQHHNRQRALRRLRLRIALTLRSDVGLADEPPPCLRDLVRGSLSPRSAEYLQAVAALLDVFVAAGCSVRDTAQRLGLSSGSLSRRLLADEHLARTVNTLRADRGMRLLR